MGYPPAALAPNASFRRKPESRKSQMKQPCGCINARGGDDGLWRWENATMLVDKHSGFRLGGRNDGVGRWGEGHGVGGRALWIPARGPE